MSEKIIFMGTPNFSIPTLERLIQSNYKLLCVYSQPPKKSSRGQKINKSPVNLYAERLNLTIRTPNDLNSEEEFNYFKKLSPDVVVVVAYGQIIPEKFLKLPKKGFINVHASLLPRWRGAAPIQRTIMNQDKETGVSIMKIVEKLDAGPIMKQKKITITEEMNAEDLSLNLSNISSKIIIDCIDEIDEGKAIFIEQNEKNATYAKKINPNEGKINWNHEADYINAQIKSLYPSPGAWFIFEGERYKILKALISNDKGKAGVVLDDQFTIACKSKSIKILEIQRQGKKRQTSNQFLLGSRIKKGINLC